MSRAQPVDWQKSDSNRDGVVDHNDLYALHRAWLMSGTPADDSWNLSGDDIYRLEGNIGIGTANPSADLDVVGTIRARLESGGSAARMNADEYGGLFEVLNSAGNAASRLWVDEGGGGLLTLNDPAGIPADQLGSDADGGLRVLENNLGAAVANVWVNSSSVGLITLNDSQGQPRLDLFSDEIGGIVDIGNYEGASAGRFWVSDEGAGLLTLNDSQENLRAVLTVLSTGAGDLRLDGPNGKANVSLASVNGNANRGVVSVHDTDGNPRAQMYVDSNGNGFVGPVTSKGTVAAGVGIDASGRGMLWAEQSIFGRRPPGAARFQNRVLQSGRASGGDLLPGQSSTDRWPGRNRIARGLHRAGAARKPDGATDARLAGLEGIGVRKPGQEERPHRRIGGRDGLL